MDLGQSNVFKIWIVIAIFGISSREFWIGYDFYLQTCFWTFSCHVIDFYHVSLYVLIVIGNEISSLIVILILNGIVLVVVILIVLLIVIWSVIYLLHPILHE